MKKITVIFLLYLIFNYCVSNKADENEFNFLMKDIKKIILVDHQKNEYKLPPKNKKLLFLIYKKRLKWGFIKFLLVTKYFSTLKMVK